MTQFVLGNVEGMFRDYIANSVALPQEIFDALTDEAQELWRTGQLAEDTILLRSEVEDTPVFPESLMPVPHPNPKIEHLNKSGKTS